MVDLSEDFRYSYFVIPMTAQHAEAAVKAIGYLTDKTGDMGSILKDWPGFDEVCPNAAERLDGTALELAQDLYGRLLPLKGNDPFDICKIHATAVDDKYAASGLHIENSTNWMPIEVAAAVIQTMQARLGAPAVRYEYADYDGGGIENSFGGGAVRVEPGEEPDFYDTTQLGTDVSSSFMSLLRARLAERRGEYELTDEYEVEHCLNMCVRDAICMTNEFKSFEKLALAMGETSLNTVQSLLSDAFLNTAESSELREMLHDWQAAREAEGTMPGAET